MQYVCVCVKQVMVNFMHSIYPDRYGRIRLFGITSYLGSEMLNAAPMELVVLYPAVQQRGRVCKCACAIGVQMLFGGMIYNILFDYLH